MIAMCESELDTCQPISQNDSPGPTDGLHGPQDESGSESHTGPVLVLQGRSDLLKLAAILDQWEKSRQARLGMAAPGFVVKLRDDILSTLKGSPMGTTAQASPVRMPQSNRCAQCCPDTKRPISAISTTQAASILGITPRAVRKKAAQLGGWRVGNSWCFDPEAINSAAGSRNGEHSG